MAVLNDLPDEVVDSICIYLRSKPNSYPLHGKQTGLYGLSLSSRKYNRIALPHLYHHVCPSNVLAGAFALTLLRNERLAGFVRSIHLEDFFPESDADEGPRATFLQYAPAITSAESNNAIAERGRQLNATSEEVGGDHVDDIFGLSLFVFVLTSLPNVETLEMVLTHQIKHSKIMQGLRSMPQPILPALKTLKVSHGDTEYGLDICNLLPLLNRTNVTSLEIFACERFEEHNFEVISSVRKLKLDRTALDQVEFDRLVRCFPHLEVFRYETADSTVTQCKDGSACTFDIGRALEPLCGTLQTLTIDQRERFILGDDDDEEKPIGSLRAFTKLKRLNIWQYDLTGSKEDEDEDENEDDEEPGGGFYRAFDEDRQGDGAQLLPWVDKLPKSLERLRIFGATDEIEAELRRLAQIAAIEYPNLKKVMVNPKLDLQEPFNGSGIAYNRVKST